MRIIDPFYTTLDAVKSQKGITNTAEDTDLTNAILQASSMMSMFCSRDFVPMVGTVYCDAVGLHIVQSTKLNLRDDLLELTTLINGDGGVLSTNQYVLRTSGQYPKWRIELLPTANTFWTFSQNWQDAITITGVWGYHESYDTAWVDTLQVIPISNLTSGATSVTLTSVTGNDARGIKAFSVGTLLKIDNEYIKVIGVNTTTQTLTLVRGVNGTTPSAHSAGALIYHWLVQQDIERLCKDFALWLHQQRDNAATRYQFLDGSQIVENSAPEHIKMGLLRYQKKRMQSI